MQASAFPALQGTGDNQVRYLEQVSEFQQAGIDREIPVVFVDLLGEGRNPGSSAFEPLRRPDNAHLIPHRPTQLVPVVRDDHPLIHVAPAEVHPFRNFHLWPTAQRLQALAGARMVVRAQRCA